MDLRVKIRNHLSVFSHQPHAVVLAFSCSFCGLTICVHTLLTQLLLFNSLLPVEFKEESMFELGSSFQVVATRTVFPVSTSPGLLWAMDFF